MKGKSIVPAAGTVEGIRTSLKSFMFAKVDLFTSAGRLMATQIDPSYACLLADNVVSAEGVIDVRVARVNDWDIFVNVEILLS